MSNIPEGWSLRALGDITQEKSLRVGRRQRIKVLSSTKHHGLVPSDEYFKNRTVYSSDLSNYKLVPRGHFAYATNHLAEGSIGLQTKYDFACVSPVYTVFSCDVEQVDVNYMFRLLKSPPLMAAYGVHEQASVDRRGAIRYRDFGRISVLLPPKVKQRRIVEILDSIDRCIACQDWVIEKSTAIYDGLAARLLRDVNVGAERLANYLALPPKNGYSPKEVDEWTGTVALGLGCLTPSGFQARQLKNVPTEGAGNASAYLSDGDLLMSRANTRELVGLVGIYRDVGARCIYPDLMMRLSPIERCRTEYLELVLRSSAVRRQIQGMAQGTSESMVKISSSIVQNLKVRIPDLAIQNQILEVIDASRARIRAEESMRDGLIRLKTGLAEDLLTGRVRVPEAEAVVGSL